MEKPWEDFKPQNKQAATQKPWEDFSKPGFVERVGQDFDKRAQMGNEIADAYVAGEQGMGSTALQMVGKMGAGGVNDVMSEAVVSGFEALPQDAQSYIKQKAGEGFNYVADSPVGEIAGDAANKIGAAYDTFSKVHPVAARNLEAVGNLSMVIPAAKGTMKAAEEAGSLAKAGAIKAAAPNIAESVKPLAKRAREFGIDLRSDQVAPTRLKSTIQKVSQEAPFSGAGEFEVKQRAQWNKAVAGALGLDAPDLSPENIIQFLKNSSVKFDSLAGKKSIPFDGTRMQGINKIVANAQDFIDPGLAHIVERNAKKITSSIENGSISGAQLGSIRSELIDNIPNASGEAKRYLSKLVEAIDDSIEPVLTAQEKETLRTARRQWRNYKTVESLLEKSTDGQINPTQLLNKVGSNKFIKASRAKVGQDDLIDLARIGKEFLPMKAGSDTMQKLAVGKAAAGGSAGTGIVGYAIADPIGALTAAGIAGAGLGANRAYQGVNSSQKLIDAALKDRRARFGLKDKIKAISKDEGSGRPNLKTKITKP